MTEAEKAALRLSTTLPMTTHEWKPPRPKKNKPRNKGVKVKTPWRKWTGD